jgi:hypothetical protein
MPGIITAAYLASASGRTGDEAIGEQVSVAIRRGRNLFDQRM